MSFLRGILILGVAWFAAGCMQFEYGIALEEDLSGTADLDIAIDLDRVAYISAFVQNAFTGEGGEPTDEQIEAAREEIRAEVDSDENFSEESLRGEIDPDLPEGVTLVYAKANRDDLLTTVNMRFAFEHVDQLREMRLDDDDEGDDGGAPVDSEPFEDLQIIEEDGFIIVQSEPINPVEEMEEMEDMPWVSDDMVEKMLEGFSVTFKLTTPFRVEEHNATSKKGKTLVWEFNLETLKSGEATGIYAKLKR